MSALSGNMWEILIMNEKGGITAVQKQLAHRNIAYSAVYAQRTDDELERILDGA